MALKYIFALLLFLLSFSYSRPTSEYFLGVRNSKYAFLGYDYNDKWAISFENSVFTQDLDLQYCRIYAIYIFAINKNLMGFYSVYTGSRYNQNYYDVGGIVSLKYSLLNDRIVIDGKFQFYYDSGLGQGNDYFSEIQVYPITTIGLVGGIKNIPEYRESQIRVFGGINIRTKDVEIRPEISVPLEDDLYYATRFSISFIYRILM